MFNQGLLCALAICVSPIGYSVSQAQSLVISEIMDEPLNADGSSNDQYGEYFEVFNPSNAEVDLQNWIIKDNGSDYHVINQSVKVPAFGFAVLGKSVNTTLNGGVPVNYEYQNDIQFDNQLADEIILINSNNVEVDRVEIGAAPTWTRIGGSAMIFTGVYFDDNNTQQNWIGAPDVENGLIFNNGSPGIGGKEQRIQFTLICDNNVWSSAPTALTGNQSILLRNSSQKIVSNVIEVKNIAIEFGSSLTIDPAGVLTVHGDILTEGNFIVENGGSLFQTTLFDNNSANSGHYQVKRNTGILVDDTRFQYWSSPIPNATMGGVFSSSNPNDFYYFDESTQQWTPQPEEQRMKPGRGYITTGSVGNTAFSDQRTFLSTAVNNGSYQLDLNINANDFALLGNPYPSALSSASFLADNPDLTGTLYFWNHTTPTQYGGNGNTGSDYAHWTLFGATSGNGSETPDDYIQSCQGFFVQADNGGVSQVVFNNAQRANADNHQFFSPLDDDARKTWINLSGTQNQFNQILVGFHPQATEFIDKGLDGVKLKGGSLALYSVAEDKDLAIQALPYPNAIHYTKIPLGIDASDAGFYTFSLDSLSNWPADQELLIFDKKYQASVDLLVDSSYTFQLDQGVQKLGRFELWTRLKMDGQAEDQLSQNQPNGSSGVTSAEEYAAQEAVKWNAFQTGSQVQLNRNLAEHSMQVAIFDVNGRLIQSFEWKAGQKTLSLNANHYSTGVYIVEIVDHQQQHSSQKLTIQ